MNTTRFKTVRLAATLAVLAALGSLLFAQGPIDDGPLNIQRLVVPPQRIAKEMEKVQQGTLVLVPLEEFEARVERVRQIRKARAEKPRLTKTHYSAELVDHALTNGSGQWTVQYAGAAPAVLPIEPLNLALARMRWEQGGDAILAEFDGKSPGLLVTPGIATCVFDWSLRGTPTNDGLVFHIAVPPGPLTTFELKLPVSYWLTAPKHVVVTGPHDEVGPGQRLWKLQVTGATQIDLNLRKIAEPKGPAPSLFARVQSIQQVAPDRVLVEHEYQIDVLHGSVRELVLRGDADFEPSDVVLKSGGEVKSWQWKEIPAKKDAKGKDLAWPSGALTIQFRQPVQGKLQGLRVRGQSPRPIGPTWTSPGLRLDGGLSRGDVLTLHLHPDVPIGKWDNGSFQLTNLFTESDGTQILTLADTATAPAGTRRPTLTMPAKGIEIATLEKHTWHVGPRRADLDVELQIAPVRGSIFELPFKLPVGLGYRVDNVEVNPPELLRRWEPRGDVLVLELKQALAPGKKAVVKLKLRASFKELTAGSRMLTCPEVLPVEAARREGTLLVTVDPGLVGQMLDSSAPLDATDPKEHGKAAWQFTFRGQRMTGVLRVTPRPAQVRIHGQHEVTLSEASADVKFRWDIEPLAAAPEHLDFRLAPGLRLDWKVINTPGSLKIHHWERLNLQDTLPHLLCLGARNELQAAMLESALPDGTLWRFHLAEPLRTKATFTLQAESLRGWDDMHRGDRWSVPLMMPAHDGNTGAQIAIHSPLNPIGAVAVNGVPVTQLHGPEKSPLMFHLDPPPGPYPDRSASLGITTSNEKRSSARLERCDEASVTTWVRREGEVTQRIRFRLWHWRDRTVEMTFPPGSVVVGAKVDEHWMERQRLAEDAKGMRLTLPVDQNADFVRYEIVVRLQSPEVRTPTTERPIGAMYVPTPAVAWPIAPLDLQRRVVLEDGWLPLDPDTLAPSGVPAPIAVRSQMARWLDRAWHLGRSWLPFGDHTEAADQLENQRQTVLLAEKKLRDAAVGNTLTFGDALEQLAFTHLKDGTPLVVDRVALRDLGLAAQTPVPASGLTPQGRPFWESLGLIYEPMQHAALLTSARRLQGLGGPSSALDAALQEAVLQGRDASGGLCLPLAWFGMPAHEENSSSAGSDPQPTTEWTYAFDSSHDVGFYIVDPLLAHTMGALLGMVVTLVLWRMQRALTSITCFRAHVLLLTAGILAAFWSPAGVCEYLTAPILFALSVSALVCVVRLVRASDGEDASQSTLVKPVAQTVGAAIVVLGLTWTATAQPAAPRTHTVYVVEGKKPAVLTTPELLAQLVEWERPAVLTTQGAVLVQAKYTGKVKDALARFDVEYAIHCTQDDSNLVIPLSGVQLQEGAFLDGAPVFPAPSKAGYSLPIKEAGAHNLRLSFSVRVANAGDHQDLKFNLPKLVQNDMRIDWTTSVQALHCLHCWGEEKRLLDAHPGVKEWRGELGGDGVFHLRWTGGGTPAAAKPIEVREAHLWDLRPGNASLTTVFHYSVGAGSLNQLSVNLPDGLYLRGVEVANLSATGPTTPVFVKQWQVLGKGGQRRATIELAQPAAGTIALNLDIVPLLALRGRKLAMPLPAPLQGKSAGGLLGYGLDAEESASAQDLAVQSLTPAEFETLWKKSGGPASAPVARAYRFQRKSLQAGLELELRGDARNAQCRWQWRLAPHHADLLGRFTLQSPFEDLMLLEFFVDPAFTLTDVYGADVKRWHQHESLLQVWLRQPRKQTAIDISGWRSLPFKGDAAGKRVIQLPRVQPIGMRIAQADLELQCEAGVHVGPDLVRRLNPPYEASIAMSVQADKPAADVLTKIQGTAQDVEMSQSIRVVSPRGKVPTLKLHLKDWHGVRPTLDAPGAMVVANTDNGLDHPVWTLQYPPGQPGEVVVTVRGRLGKDKQGRLGLPVVELDGANLEQTWIAWQDVEISSAGKKVANERGLADKITQQTGAAWLRETGWQTARAAAGLKVALPKAQPHSLVRIVTGSESVRRVDGHWLHEAAVWVHARAPAELRLRFPGEVASFSSLLDQHLQQSWSANAKEYVLPVDANPLPRLVEMRWRYVDGAETERTPNLTALQIDEANGAELGRVLWLPPGMTTDTKRAPTFTEQLVQEAREHMLIASSLAEDADRPPSTLKRIGARQQKFFACLRQAEHSLSCVSAVERDFNPADIVSRVDALKRKNADLAKAGRYDDQRKAAEKAMQLTCTPFSSEVAETPILLTPTTSSVPVQSVADQLAAVRRNSAEWILLAAVFLLVASYFRRGLSLMRRLAPEIGIALAAAAMVIFGVSMLGIAWIALMLLVRALWITAAVRRRFTPPQQATTIAAPAPASSGRTLH